MSKYPPLRPKQIEQVLNKLGFNYVRTRGDHRIWVKEGKNTIPVPLYEQISNWLLSAIIRQSGVSKKKFYELL